MECHGTATTVSRHAVMVMKCKGEGNLGKPGLYRQQSSKQETKYEMYEWKKTVWKKKNPQSFIKQYEKV